MPHRRASMIMIVAVLAGCTQFPDLDSAISPGAESADYPDLVPLETLQARTTEPTVTPSAISGIEARIANLRARAARLKGTIIDHPTRARLTAGVSEG